MLKFIKKLLATNRCDLCKNKGDSYICARCDEGTGVENCFINKQNYACQKDL